jgi:protein-S-isoprenylcysteine O-methyltransferase Ste14
MDKGIFKRHHDREDLAGEHVWGDVGQAVLLMIFLTVWVVDSFFLELSRVITVSLFIRLPLAVMVFVLSGYLARKGLVLVFGEVRHEPIVIRKGVFSVVRHPIYLAAILFYMSLLIFSFSILAAVVWVITIGFYLFLCRHEEKLLLDKFGKAYEEYMKDVPMLIPRVFRRKNV